MSTQVGNECFINGVRYQCRTCFDPGLSLYSLNEQCYGTKTWRDLLREVGQLQTNEDELLPKKICSKCLDRLITFYDFILQIDKVNNKYLELLSLSKDPLETHNYEEKYKLGDSTIESDIDSSTEEFVSEIKVENEAIVPYHIASNDKIQAEDITSTLAQTLAGKRSQNIQSGLHYTTDSCNDNLHESSKSSSEESDFDEPLNKLKIECRKCKKKFSNIADCCQHLKAKYSQRRKKRKSSSSLDKSDAKLIALSNSIEIEMVNNYFVCPICKKMFTLKASCRRHICYAHLTLKELPCGFCEKKFKTKEYLYKHLKKMHPGESVESNNKHIIQLFGERLYAKPTTWHHVECKLCSATFNTTKQLREHLKGHSNIETLHNINLNDQIVQHFFSNTKDLNVIKTNIAKDISEKNYSKYYSVLNEYCYEMTLSDTEAEDLENEIVERIGKYKCELCNETFPFKYQAYYHLEKSHSKENIHLECEQCNLQFISINLYEQHLQRHCNNKQKLLSCDYCPGKFIWPENLKNHNCYKEKSNKQKRYLCGFCTKDFTLLKYLDDHLQHYHPGNTLDSNKKLIIQLFRERLYAKPTVWHHVKCKLCFKTFDSTKQLREHLKGHSNIDTLDYIKLNDQIQDFFSHIRDLNSIKQAIVKDISKQNYSKYYSVLNRYCYEMTISDTEVEDLENESTERIGKYKCSFCDQQFSFKYQTFFHLENAHSKEYDIHLECKRCNLQFISTDLCEQHLKNHCNNKHKLIKCEYCPGKFIWEENMKKHICLQQKLETINTSHETIIRCTLCKDSFGKLKDLHQHMPIHADGITGIDFKDCIYVKTFKDLNQADYPLWQQQIKDSFSKSQISRFYQAIDKYGNELDISDSDSSTEDERDADASENVTKQYTCEICKNEFKRRKLLLNHQHECHSNITLPFTCSNCNQQYVNNELLQQHLKRLCRNEYRLKAKQCEICNARFIWPDNLLKHKEIQHNSKTIKSSSNASKTMLSTVNENREPNRNSTTPPLSVENLLPFDELSINAELLEDPSCLYYCIMCPKTFFSIEHLNDHLLRHRLSPTDIKAVEGIVHSTWWPNGVKTIKCKICDQTFKTMLSLKEHFSSNKLHNVASHQYSLANYSITNQKGFELHLDLDSETEDETGHNESNIYPYMCYICNKSLKRKYQVAQHQRAMHNYELLEFRCERCIFRTVSQPILNYHKLTQCFNTEKKYKCNQCNFKFMWQENLKNHIITFHSSSDFNISNDIDLQEYRETQSSSPEESMIPTRLQNDELSHQCTFCAKLFNKLDDLTLHLLDHDVNKPTCSKELASGTDPEKHYMTENQKELSTLHNVSRREKSTGKKKTLCSICGNYLAANTSLTLHMRKHTGERPHKCEFCEKSFARRCDLMSHRRIHTGEQPYQCVDCEKKFKSSTHLKRHIKIHTGERRYKCKYCEKTFYNSSNFKLHVRLHTGEKPFSCDVCDERFLCSRYLRKHRIKNNH